MSKKQGYSTSCLLARFTLGPENGSSMFLWNVGKLQLGYTRHSLEVTLFKELKTFVPKRLTDLTRIPQVLNRLRRKLRFMYLGRLGRGTGPSKTYTGQQNTERRGHTEMTREGFKLNILCVFKRFKTIRTFSSVAILIGLNNLTYLNSELYYEFAI
jgi:hypothetical protein